MNLLDTFIVLSFGWIGVGIEPEVILHAVRVPPKRSASAYIQNGCPVY